MGYEYGWSEVHLFRIIFLLLHDLILLIFLLLFDHVAYMVGIARVWLLLLFEFAWDGSVGLRSLIFSELFNCLRRKIHVTVLERRRVIDLNIFVRDVGAVRLQDHGALSATDAWAWHVWILQSHHHGRCEQLARLLMSHANLISAESRAINQFVLLPWCVCVTLDEWELALAAEECGYVLWVDNLEELIMVLAADYDDLLPLLLVEEALDKGPGGFERCRRIDDDRHIHALRIIVRGDLQCLPEHGLHLLRKTREAKSFQIDDGGHLRDLRLREVAHGQEAELEASFVVCVDVLEEALLSGHLQHLIWIDLAAKVVVYGVAEPVNAIVAPGVDLDHLRKLIVHKIGAEIVNLIGSPLSNEILPHFHSFCYIKLPRSAEPEQVLIREPRIVKSEIAFLQQVSLKLIKTLLLLVVEITEVAVEKIRMVSVSTKDGLPASNKQIVASRILKNNTYPVADSTFFFFLNIFNMDEVIITIKYLYIGHKRINQNLV